MQRAAFDFGLSPTTLAGGPLVQNKGMPWKKTYALAFESPRFIGEDKLAFVSRPPSLSVCQGF